MIAEYFVIAAFVFVDFNITNIEQGVPVWEQLENSRGALKVMELEEVAIMVIR